MLDLTPGQRRLCSGLINYLRTLDGLSVRRYRSRFAVACRGEEYVCHIETSGEHLEVTPPLNIPTTLKTALMRLAETYRTKKAGAAGGVSVVYTITKGSLEATASEDE